MWIVLRFCVQDLRNKSFCFFDCLQDHLLWRRVMLRSSFDCFSCVMASCTIENGASIVKKIYKYRRV